MEQIAFFDKTIHYETVESTFKEAARLIKTKQAEGNFIIIADKQKAGIGRKGNDWYSPEGGLWVTAGLYNLPVKNCITIFTALMIIRSIAELYPQTEEHLAVKWPNDVLLKGKKLAGILTSFYPSFNYLLIGIGLNANNTQFPSELEAISLASYFAEENIDGIYEKIDTISLLNCIFKHFGEQLPIILDSELESFLEDYYRYSCLEEKNITLATEFQDFQGKVKGVNREGCLMIELESGLIQPFLSGTIIKR